METGLADRVVVVTGASGGIGSAIARAFAAEGCKVVLHFLSGNTRILALSRTVAGADVLPVRADLRKEADVRRLFALTTKKFGRVDTVIANAGAWDTANIPLHQMSFARWRETMDGVLTATFLTMREFFKIVASQKHGNAVMIGSTAAVFGEAGHADYAAAKAAMAFGLTRSLKNEIARLAPHTRKYCGGRVNCVCPGWTTVPRLKEKFSDTHAVKRVTATMALPQMARPEDIASTCVFLSSDLLARHITGQTIVVAGGMEGRWLWTPAEIDASAI